MTFSKRLASLFIPYVVAQLIGAIVAALLLYAIAKGHPGFDLAGGFATNGYGDDRRSMRHMKFLQAEARWWISPLVI
jgi:glycerol uptake facilitator-like aquaporin